MAYNVPYTFIPGTKAKANEVNSNFSKITDYLTELNADLTNTTANVSTIQTDLTKTKTLFQEGRTKFCVNSSEGILIATSGTNLYFNYSFTITNAKGITATITSVQPINCQGFSNGTHNIFIGLDGSSEHFTNTVYKQKIEPTTKNINDIWLNTSKEPIFAGKWDGTIWQEYLKVPVGNVIITNSAITSTTIFEYNQNGYSINQNSTAVTDLSALSQTGKNTITTLMMPDYSKGANKTWNTVCQAETDGWIRFQTMSYGGSAAYLYWGLTNSTVTTVIGIIEGNTNAEVTPLYPISKGEYYKATGGYQDQLLTFYPVKGANQS